MRQLDHWIKNNPIPGDQVRWVRSYSLLQERSLYELWQQLDKAAKKPAGPLEKKYGDFYAAGMNVEELQKKGLESLKPALERISALNDSKGIATLIVPWATLPGCDHHFVRAMVFAVFAQLPRLGRNDGGAGLAVDHVTIWRWVQRHAPILSQRLRRERRRNHRITGSPKAVYEATRWKVPIDALKFRVLFWSCRVNWSFLLSERGAGQRLLNCTLQRLTETEKRAAVTAVTRSRVD